MDRAMAPKISNQLTLRTQANTLVVVLAALGLTSGAVMVAGRSLHTRTHPTDAAGCLNSWPLLATGGALILVFGILITVLFLHARRTRQFRRKMEEMSRIALFASKTDHVAIITNAEGIVEWVNEGFTRASGFDPEDAIGKAPASLLLGPLQNVTIIHKVREAIANEKPLTVEMLCSHKRGNRYWLSLSLTPVLDAEGQLSNYVALGSDITARRRADEEINRVNKRNELLLSAAGEGIFGLDVQGSITFVNPAGARLTGWAAKDLVGQPVSVILHQLRLNRLPGTQDDLFTGAAFIDGTVLIGDTDEFKRHDGSPFPVEYTSTPLREADQSIGSVVVFRDITDRRQGEVMRARQGRQFALRADVAFGLTNGDNLKIFLSRSMQSIVKHMDGAYARVWTLNSEDNMLELQASAGMYTHTDGQHSRIPVGVLKVGKIAREGMPQVSHNLVTDADVIDKEWVLRERMQSFIGFPLFVESRVVGVMAMFSRNRLPEDAVELMAAVADTIAQGTVRKSAEAKIAEQAALLDESSDAIVVLDLNSRCTYWNKAAERMYGWQAREAYGKTADQLLFPDRAYFDRAKALTLQRGSYRDDSCQITNAIVETRWSLVHDDEGRPKSILIINTDISEKKKIEAQFLRTQRMESIGTLAGGIAHDLNNVLAPILMSVEMLKMKFNDPSSERLLNMLESSAKRGAGMVKQVLTFARGVDGERVLLQPKHLIKDIAKIIDDTFPKTVKLKTAISENLWPVLGDATQLHQVLLNLTVNARDAMPNGGTINVVAENVIIDEAPGEGGAQTPAPGFYVVVKVSDNGTGIPKEVLDKIFEPFFTTKEVGKGTGLGLSTVLGIIKSHNGLVQVQTEVNRGTTFVVYLPAQEAAQMLAAESEVKNLPAGNGELILAVDDEASVLSMTKETLEAFGYRVITARDGAEAVAVYSAHKDEIRGVLTDMLMPHMDGPATIRVLKKLDPNVRIIAASGLFDADKVKDATGLDKIAFLMKPYTAESLLKTVHQVLSEAA